MLSTTQQPGGRQQGDKVENVLRHLVAPGYPAVADVARGNVPANHEGHAEHEQRRHDHQGIEQGAITAREHSHPRPSPFTLDYLEKSAFSFGPCSGLWRITPAHPAS